MDVESVAGAVGRAELLYARAGRGSERHGGAERHHGKHINAARNRTLQNLLSRLARVVARRQTQIAANSHPQTVDALIKAQIGRPRLLTVQGVTHVSYVLDTV